MIKKILICLVSIGILSIFPFSREAVDAFTSFNLFGGAIHQDISRKALAPLGIAEDSMRVINDGNASQDHIGTKNFLTPSHHFDDDRLADGVNYMNGQLADAVNYAAEAEMDKKARENTLYAFGEMIHTAQDFYAHSNYVELYLKKNAFLMPKDIPLPDWNAIADLKPSRTGLKSGYFYYANIVNNEKTNSRQVSADLIKMKFKGTKFLSDKEYAEAAKDFDSYLKYAAEVPIDVLHRDINKDNNASSAGKMIDPATDKYIFDYAFDLAVRETDREWARLEEGIKMKYPAKADKIILSLKKGVGKI